MAVSISNMSQVWMSNTNTYNAIAMSVSTMGYGANANSKLLLFKVDGNTKFSVSANGDVIANNIFANTLTVNTLITLSGLGYLSNASGVSFNGNLFFPSGNVGIGTSSPSAKLHVVGGAIMPAVGNSPSAGIYWPADPGGGAGDSAWIRYSAVSGETTNFRIGTDNDADDTISLWQMGADRLTVYNGNVGIGTTLPSQKLHVEGSVLITNTITADTITANLVTANTITANLVTSNTITANLVTANTVNASIYYDSSNTRFHLNPASTSELFAANFQRPTFVPRYTLYFDATNSSRTTPNTFTKSYTASEVTFGSLIGQFYRSFNVGGSFLFEMNVSCISATSVTTYMMNIDDNAYFYLNRGLIQSVTGAGSKNTPITYNLIQGLNTIHIVMNNSGGGDGSISYMADFFQNGNTAFIPP